MKNEKHQKIDLREEIYNLISSWTENVDFIALQMSTIEDISLKAKYELLRKRLFIQARKYVKNIDIENHNHAVQKK